MTERPLKDVDSLVLMQRAASLAMLINTRADDGPDPEIDDAIAERAVIRRELHLRDYEIMKERGELPDDE